MRLAVLALASHAPRALAATAHYFAPSDADLYVHVDARVARADYVRDAGPLPPRVGFVEPARPVYWAGFSMIEATLDLLRVAVREGPYDRYLFISDNSLPVRTLEDLFVRLAASEDLIVCRRMPPAHPLRARYDAFHLIDGETFDCRREWASPRPLGEADFDRIERVSALRRRGKKPLDLFHGHASWALSHDSVSLALGVVDRDPWFVESCRFSAHADEFFFQSLVGAAKYPDGLGDSPTYSDTCRFAPRLIRSARDLPFDMAPHFLFLRKIAPDFEAGLPQTMQRLYGGLRHMLANDPLAARESLIGLAVGPERHLHLFAPRGDDPAWSEPGKVWSRPFRRLTGDRAAWRLRAPASWPQVRLSLTCVIGVPAPAGAFFEIEGQTAPLQETDVGFGALFDGLTRPFDSITLHAPQSGLAVATLPEA